MGLTLAQAKRMLLLNKEAGNATLLRSPSGYGKSQGALQAFDELEATNKVMKKTTGLGIIYAATVTSPDLLGLPWKGTRTVTFADGREPVTVTVTEPAAPQWMLDVRTGAPAWAFNDFVLIVEEYGQGTPEAKRSIAELMNTACLPPHSLPPGAGRWGMTNSGSRYGVNKDFLFAISRRTEIDIVPDVKGLSDHWENPYKWHGKTWEVSPLFKAWINSSSGKEVIFQEPDAKKDDPWCNPRTALSADRFQQTYAAHGNRVTADDDMILTHFVGTIGHSATAALTEFIRFDSELPKYAQVVADPTGTPLPIRGDLQLLMAYKLAADAIEAELGPVIQYVDRLAQDYSPTFMKNLLKRSPKAIIANPAVQGWTARNKNVLNMIAAMIQDSK